MSAFSEPGYELVQLDQDENGNPIYGYVATDQPIGGRDEHA